MKKKDIIELDSSISNEEALKLLYSNDSVDSLKHQYMDEYGNYVYTTDLVANTPNTVSGTSLGLSFNSALSTLERYQLDNLK